MPTKKLIAGGCGCAALVSLIVVAAIGIFIWDTTQEISGVSIAVKSLSDVSVGQTFTLAVTVTNQRSRSVMSLTDIDLADDYLKGFTVLTTQPAPKSSESQSLLGSRSFTFDVEVPPGQSRNFVFSLRAEKPGLFRGDVDVWEGHRFVTNMAQTMVKSKRRSN